MPGFTIQQLQTVTDGTNGYDAQAFPDRSDLQAIANARNGTGVVSGCAVTAESPAALGVSVASGVVLIAGKLYSVVAAKVALATATTDDRRDAVVVTPATPIASTYYVTKTKTGTLAKLSTSGSTTSTPTHVGRSVTPSTRSWFPVGLGSAATTTRSTGTGIGAFGTGNGALFTTSLSGKAVPPGTWSMTLKLGSNGNTVTAKSVHVRIGFKNGSTYTQLGSDLVITTRSFSGADTFTLSGSLPGAVIGTTTRLYAEVWINGNRVSGATFIHVAVGAALCPLSVPAGTAAVPAVVKGTECSVSGWTRTMSSLPPMKPAVTPATEALCAEVALPGSATSVVAKNIVDKRCFVVFGLVAQTLATGVSVSSTTTVFTLTLGVGIWVIVPTLSMSADTKRQHYGVACATGTAVGTFTGPTSVSGETYFTPNATSFAVRSLSTAFHCTTAGTVLVQASASGATVKAGSGVLAYRIG